MKLLDPDASIVDSTNLVKAMEPIMQTSSYMMEQIIQGGISISETAGNISIHSCIHTKLFIIILLFLLFFLEFSYTDYTLTKKEVVFYYHRYIYI